MTSANQDKPATEPSARPQPRSMPASGTQTPADARPQSGWDRFVANGKTFTTAVLFALGIRYFLFEPFAIEGPSMEPSLLNGDRVIVAKYRYGLFLPFMSHALVSWGTPAPGDVVIVKSPADDVDIVKRVIGIPGDVIEIHDEEVFRNGRSIRVGSAGPCQGDRMKENWLTECRWVEEKSGGKTYRTSFSSDSSAPTPGPVTVPAGHVFILGDHRDRSNDSRFIGPVPINRIKGKGLMIYWSRDRDVRWNRLLDSL
jgi:signal peptidase I